MLKNFRLTIKKSRRERGMTYVELIVVLTIFSVVSSIVIFNYKQFQSKVDLKNLTDEIAMKIVRAQKDAISGELSPLTSLSTWKPAYGLYFSSLNSKQFVYFTDLDNLGDCNAPQCIAPNYTTGGEVTEVIDITKGNFIPTDGLGVVGVGCPSTPLTDISFTFKRPDTAPIIKTNPSLACSVSYFTIQISSRNNVIDIIKVYPSGRIQIN